MNCYGPAWRQAEYPGYYESDSGLSYADGPCTRYFDQIKWVIRELQKNPMSRRAVVAAWQPHIAHSAPLPPCHCMFILNVQNTAPKGARPYEAVAGFCSGTEYLGVVWADNKDQAYELARAEYGEQLDSMPDGEPVDCLIVREPIPSRLEEYLKVRPLNPPGQQLCLHLTQRSCDVALGVPYNTASYALLLHLMSRFLNIEPGIFGHTLVDAHIYCAEPGDELAKFDHRAGLQKQLTREPRPLPKLKISDDIQSLEDVERLLHPSVTTEEIMEKFILEGYDPHSFIQFEVAV
jgi:thymidylate synthase